MLPGRAGGRLLAALHALTGPRPRTAHPTAQVMVLRRRGLADPRTRTG
ncbi:hypothetical protein [Streptomyces sp. NPDC057939]